MKKSKTAWALSALVGPGLIAATGVIGLGAGGSGCGGGTTAGNPATEDSSASGAALGAVGGALSGSGAGGTLASRWGRPSMGVSGLVGARERGGVDALLAAGWSALGVPSAFATVVCPTFRSGSSSGCSASGASMWLSYSDCSFAGAAAIWSGVQALTPSSGAAACGTFPSPGANGTLVRQIVAAAGGNVPSSLVVTSSAGVVATLDDASTNLGNFDGATIAPIANNGYGSKITFGASGRRTALEIARHLTISAGGAAEVNQSITGSLSVSESSGASSRAVSGSIKVYYNGLRVVGVSTFSDLSHTDGCCLPTSGKVTTTFERGANVWVPSVLGRPLLGRTETLEITGCGTGTLTEYDGTVKEVSLNRCF